MFHLLLIICILSFHAVHAAENDMQGVTAALTNNQKQNGALAGTTSKEKKETILRDILQHIERRYSGSSDLSNSLPRKFARLIRHANSKSEERREQRKKSGNRLMVNLLNKMDSSYSPVQDLIQSDSSEPVSACLYLPIYRDPKTKQYYCKKEAVMPKDIQAKLVRDEKKNFSISEPSSLSSESSSTKRKGSIKKVLKRNQIIQAKSKSSSSSSSS